MPVPPYSSILFVAATPQEFRCVATRSGAGGDAGAGWTLHAVSSEGNSASVLFTGIGSANAAAATAWVLGSGAVRPSCIINLGIAGALPLGAPELGDVVIAGESVFYEEGIATPEGFRDLAALGFDLVPGAPDWCAGNHLAPDAGLHDWVSAALKSLHPRFGIVATVSRCSGTDAAASEVQSVTGAVAEAMEGAAVILAARRLGVPAVEVRVISNTCGHRNRQHWDMDTACRRIADVVRHLLTV